MGPADVFHMVRSLGLEPTCGAVQIEERICSLTDVANELSDPTNKRVPPSFPSVLQPCNPIFFQLPVSLSGLIPP